MVPLSALLQLLEVIVVGTAIHLRPYLVPWHRRAAAAACTALLLLLLLLAGLSITCGTAGGAAAAANKDGHNLDLKLQGQC